MTLQSKMKVIEDAQKAAASNPFVEINRRLNALEFQARKIQHDYAQIIIWFSNTRKRLVDAGVFDARGDYIDRYNVERFKDGCPKLVRVKRAAPEEPQPPKKRRSPTKRPRPPVVPGSKTGGDGPHS